MTTTGHLQLTDLHNPGNIIAVLEYRTNRYIEAGELQGFQVTPGKVELWGMESGRLLKICGWLKTSVAQYSGV